MLFMLCCVLFTVLLKETSTCTIKHLFICTYKTAMIRSMPAWLSNVGIAKGGKRTRSRVLHRLFRAVGNL